MKTTGQQRTRRLDGIMDSMDEFEQIPGDSGGQGSLECCSSWGCKELNTTERLNEDKDFFFSSGITQLVGF